jgi:hypothetical protein
MKPPPDGAYAGRGRSSPSLPVAAPGGAVVARAGRLHRLRTRRHAHRHRDTPCTGDHHLVPEVTAIYQLVNDGLAPVWRGERTAEEALRDLGPQVQRMAGLGP